MKKGEIWVIELPFMEGREQRGKRPALVLGNTKIGMIIIVPLTSNIQALRFSHTLEIKKSRENGLEKDSIAMVFQVQSLDEKRFINKIGFLEDNYLKDINEIIKNLLEL